MVKNPQNQGSFLGKLEKSLQNHGINIHSYLIPPQSHYLAAT